MKKEIQIACPCCKNKRLFDADPDTEGIIKIKCPICKGVIAVSFHSKRIRTERIGACFIHSDQGLTKYRCNITCILSGFFCVLGCISPFVQLD